MGSGYADYIRMRESDSGDGQRSGGFDDWSRVVLFVLLLLAAAFGYYFTIHINQPKRVLNTSVVKTLKSPFKASIEGRTVLRDSLLAVYRSREIHTPGREIAVESAPESSPAPFDTRQALELVRAASRAEELEREDMYGHPTRHFYGEISCGNAGANRPSGYYFEYWADLRDLSAVRLIMTGVCRNAAVDAKGDSISSETSLNIRFH